MPRKFYLSNHLIAGGITHPNAAALYAARVADLQAALNDEQIRSQAAEALSGLIEKVVLTPDAFAPDGLWAELHGDLAMILSLAGLASQDNKPLALNAKNPRSRYVSEGILRWLRGPDLN